MRNILLLSIDIMNHVCPSDAMRVKHTDIQKLMEDNDGTVKLDCQEFDILGLPSSTENSQQDLHREGCDDRGAEGRELGEGQDNPHPSGTFDSVEGPRLQLNDCCKEMVACSEMSDSRRLSMRQTKRMSSPLRESNGSAARDLVLMDKVEEDMERRVETHLVFENRQVDHISNGVVHSASFHDVKRMTCSPIPISRKQNDSTESQVTQLSLSACLLVLLSPSHLLVLLSSFALLQPPLVTPHD